MKNMEEKNANARLCTKCGAELQDGQEFCPKCGQKTEPFVTENENSTAPQFDTGLNKKNGGKKKKTVIIIVASVLALAIIVAGILIIPKLLVSVEDLCAQGNYEKAYEKASDEEKDAIKAENVAAVQSAFSADNLKDPSSFKLRDAYYDEFTNDYGILVKRLVLYISAANSYGATVSSYWLYFWDEDDRDWSYYCSVSSLETEESSKYDDEDEALEKFINNTGRVVIRTTMSDGIKLSKDAVKRINTMFENGTLDDVKLIDVD